MSAIWISILVMAAVSYAIRVLPLTLIRRRIDNTFVQSFLYYVPYVTLAVMTFPAILAVTEKWYAGAVAFVTGLVLAWIGADLVRVALACCAAVFIVELF